MVKNSNSSNTLSKKQISSDTIHPQPTSSKATYAETISSKKNNPDAVHFESETHAPFEQEPVYQIDSFPSTEPVVEKTQTPPDFQQALKQLPLNLQTSFQDILHAKIVGIWPIRRDGLKK